MHLLTPNSSIHSRFSRIALRYPRDDTVHLVVPNSSIVSPSNEAKTLGAMKLTKNIGMILLAVYLIVDGLLGFGLNIGPAIFLLYIVALAAGVFILLGK